MVMEVYYKLIKRIFNVGNMLSINGNEILQDSNICCAHTGQDSIFSGASCAEVFRCVLSVEEWIESLFWEEDVKTYCDIVLETLLKRGVVFYNDQAIKLHLDYIVAVFKDKANYGCAIDSVNLEMLKMFHNSVGVLVKASVRKFHNFLLKFIHEQNSKYLELREKGMDFNTLFKKSSNDIRIVTKSGGACLWFLYMCSTSSLSASPSPKLKLSKYVNKFLRGVKSETFDFGIGNKLDLMKIFDDCVEGYAGKLDVKLVKSLTMNISRYLVENFIRKIFTYEMLLIRHPSVNGGANFFQDQLEPRLSILFNGSKLTDGFIYNVISKVSYRKFIEFYSFLLNNRIKSNRINRVNRTNVMPPIMHANSFAARGSIGGASYFSGSASGRGRFQAGIVGSSLTGSSFVPSGAEDKIKCFFGLGDVGKFALKVAKKFFDIEKIKVLHEKKLWIPDFTSRMDSDSKVFCHKLLYCLEYYSKGKHSNSFQENFDFLSKFIENRGAKFIEFCDTFEAEWKKNSSGSILATMSQEKAATLGKVEPKTRKRKLGVGDSEESVLEYSAPKVTEVMGREEGVGVLYSISNMEKKHVECDLIALPKVTICEITDVSSHQSIGKAQN